MSQQRLRVAAEFASAPTGRMRRGKPPKTELGVVILK